MIPSHARFMVSLDFEMYWGSRDLQPLSTARIRASGMRSAVESLLSVFREYGIHATWATVGMLFLKDRHELLDVVPGIRPSYLQPELSPYRDLNYIGSTESDEPSCYGASLVQQIRETPFQEVATHTFSHYYCLEDGQTSDTFEADLAAAIRAALLRRCEIQSIVFPRNQVNPAYLSVCAERGILTFRGTPRSWMFRPMKRSSEPLFKRAARIVNAFVPVSGVNSLPMSTIAQQDPPFDFSGTTHLRPSLLRHPALRAAALKRIYGEIDYAAKNGHLYHLWFHPEDFAVDTNAKLDILRQILTHVARLRSANQIESSNMRELALELLNAKSYQTSRLTH